MVGETHCVPDVALAYEPSEPASGTGCSRNWPDAIRVGQFLIFKPEEKSGMILGPPFAGMVVGAVGCQVDLFLLADCQTEIEGGRAKQLSRWLHPTWPAS
jgi:hypothetical protein